MCIHTHARSCFQIWVMHIYRVHVQKNNNFLIHIYVTRSREMSRMSTIFNFEISTPLSGNSRMLHFNANLIIIWYLVTELWVIRWKQYKTKEFECFLCLYLKNNATSDSFPLIMSHMSLILCLIAVNKSIIAHTLLVCIAVHRQFKFHPVGLYNTKTRDHSKQRTWWILRVMLAIGYSGSIVWWTASYPATTKIKTDRKWRMRGMCIHKLNTNSQMLVPQRNQLNLR